MFLPRLSVQSGGHTQLAPSPGAHDLDVSPLSELPTAL